MIICIKKIVKGFFILVKRILFLTNDIYKTYLSYILDILFTYKISFFIYENYSIRTIAIDKYFQFYT